jgi:hypothetical protein
LPSETGVTAIPAAMQGGLPVMPIKAACASAVPAKAKWAAAILAFPALPFAHKVAVAAVLTCCITTAAVVRERVESKPAESSYQDNSSNYSNSHSPPADSSSYSPSTHVPEPSAGLLSAAVAAGALRRRRRTRVHS